jgi:hypothetical protein
MSIFLSAAISEGTFGARPAPSIDGRLYFATDTKQWFQDTGTVWQDVTPDGTFLEEVIVFTGASGALSHTPIPGKRLDGYRNGIRMTSLAGSPAIQTFSIVGAAVTLSVAAGGSDVFIFAYQH